MAPDLVTIDGLDRYTYTRNSPIGHNDPTGMDTASDLTDLRKAFERSGLTEFEFLTKLDTYLYGGFDETRTNHTFRDTEGHLGEDTLGNRWRLNQARYNENNYAGTDRAGNRNYIQDEADGTQTWVSVKNGKIVNGGVNKGGRPYEWDTTLQRLKRVVSDEGATGDTNADTSSEIPIDEPIEPTSFEGGVGPPNIVSGAGPGASTDRFLRCLENPDAEFLPGC